MRKIGFGFVLSLLFNGLYAQNWKDNFKVADSLYTKGEYSKAIAVYEDALPMAEKELGNESKSYASKLNSVANCYLALGEYAKAEIYFIESKNIRATVLGKESSDYAVSCNNLAELYRKQGLFSKSEMLFVESMQLKEKTMGKETNSYALTCNNLALVYVSLGKYELAESLFLEAKNIQQKVLGVTHRDYANTCNNLSDLYKKRGFYAKAEMLCKEAMQIREKVLGKEHPMYAGSCISIASIYEMQGLFKEAEMYYKEAKNIREKMLGKEHVSYANSCSNLAKLYGNQGMYAKSELLYEEALGIIEKKLGKSHIEYANLQGNLAELYRKQGLYAKAEPLTIEAKNITESILGKNHPDYAVWCNNLAVLYEKKGLYAKAIPLHQESKRIFEQVFGKDHAQYANSCNNLAMIYKDQRKYDMAEQLFIEAKDIKEKALGKTHPSYATTCNNLALVYQKQGKTEKAESLFKEAIQIIENSFGKNHISYGTFTSNLAETYSGLSNYNLAEYYYLESLKPLLFQIDNNFSTLSEKEKGIAYKGFSKNFEIFNSFSAIRYQENPKISIEIYNNVLFTKALLFNASDKMRNRILTSKDTQLIHLYEFWKSRKSNLVRMYEINKVELTKQGIDIKALEAEINTLEKQLFQKSEIFATVNDKKKYTWVDIQQKLKTNEVAIEIIRFRVYNQKWTDSVKYMALIVSPTSKYPEMVILNNGNELEGKFAKYYQNAIKSKLEDEISYQQFWAKIDDKLKNVSKVYLSYDGVYNSLSMNTLFDAVARKYISEKYDLEVLTNTKDLCLRKKETNTTFKTGALFGFPDYNLGISVDATLQNDSIDFEDQTERFFRGEMISDLPATKTEVENLEKILRSKQIFVSKMLGKDASESKLKTVQNPDILHIATHGFFLADVEKSKEDDKNLSMDTKTLKSNPLLRSGLLFSNAKSAIKNGGDGVLTAFEAMNLELDKTELVVMSACETGLGEIRNGEGVYGLQRAFQTAGAKTVLMSLWTVSDDATQKLMTLFYENLIGKSQPKRVAFANAQKELRKIYPAPYYWGAFVMVGE